jgi:hypothetical protein
LVCTTMLQRVDPLVPRAALQKDEFSDIQFEPFVCE